MPTIPYAQLTRGMPVLQHDSGLRRGLLGEWFVPTPIDIPGAAFLFLPAEHKPRLNREERACFERNMIGEGAYEVLEQLDRSLKHHARGAGRGWATMAVGLRARTVTEPIAGIHMPSRIQHLFTQHLFIRSGFKIADRTTPDQVPMLKALLPHLYACSNVWWAWETLCEVSRLLVPEKVVARWLSERGTSYARGRNGQRVEARYGDLSNAWVRWLGSRMDMNEVQEACGIMKAVYALYEIGGEKAVLELKDWPVRIGSLLGDYRTCRIEAAQLAGEHDLLAG
jgi:hypothetical protein